MDLFARRLSQIEDLLIVGGSVHRGPEHEALMDTDWILVVIALLVAARLVLDVVLAVRARPRTRPRRRAVKRTG